MSFKHLVVATSTLLAAPFASAGATAVLGTPAPLPLVEGGLLTVAAVAVVVGVRIVRARQGAKPKR
jgi:hypothetical protein